MYRVSCKQCGASGITEDGNRLQAAVSCSCCPEAHDHDEAANGCQGAGSHPSEQHPGAECAHPSAAGRACVSVTPAGEECPGGHCYPGVEGCTVCRPLLVEFIGQIGRPVGAGA